MGTINCTLDSNGTLTITSISGASPSTTWARLHHSFFQFFGGGSFELVLTAPFSSFQFESPDPIDWGTNGQPSWITIPSSSSPTTELTLQIDSTAVGASEFTVLNTGQGALSIMINIQSLGGSGGSDATIDSYVGDAQTALIGPMPAGVVAGGTNVQFGFQDSGENELVFVLEGTIEINSNGNGIEWLPQGKPSFIDVGPLTSSPLTFTIDNDTSLGKTESEFLFHTNVGTIDPTIITNPDENGPQANG